MLEFCEALAKDYTGLMKYVTVTIGRDPSTGLLKIDQKATRAKVQAVKKSGVRKTSTKSLVKVQGTVKKGASGVYRSVATAARSSKR